MTIGDLEAMLNNVNALSHANAMLQHRMKNIAHVEGTDVTSDMDHAQRLLAAANENVEVVWSMLDELIADAKKKGSGSV